jgi:hypothetical protein
MDQVGSITRHSQDTAGKNKHRNATMTDKKRLPTANLR